MDLYIKKFGDNKVHILHEKDSKPLDFSMTGFILANMLSTITITFKTNRGLESTKINFLVTILLLAILLQFFVYIVHM